MFWPEKRTWLPNWSRRGDHNGGVSSTPRPEVPSAEGWVTLGRDSDRYLLMPAKINGQPVSSALHTGTPRSIVKREMAMRLRLPLAGKTSGRSFVQDEAAPLHRLRSLCVGELSLDELDIATNDIPLLKQALTREVPLLVGLDVLRKGVVDLQLTQRRGRIRGVFSPDEGPPYKKMVLSRGPAGVPEMMVGPEDKAAERALIDLGSNIVCSMSAAYAEKAGLLTGRRLSTTMTAGMEGIDIGLIFTLRSLDIGPYQLRQIPVCAIDNWKLEAPISLGWPLFRRFDIAIAYNRHLFLRANAEHLGLSMPRDRSGIGALRLSDHLHIRHVATGSPAERAGLSVNDRIVAIDGRLIDSSYPPPGSRQGHRPSGTSLDIVLADGRQVTLVLKDYF